LDPQRRPAVFLPAPGKFYFVAIAGDVTASLLDKIIREIRAGIALAELLVLRRHAMKLWKTAFAASFALLMFAMPVGASAADWGSWQPTKDQPTSIVPVEYYHYHGDYRCHHRWFRIHHHRICG
jgi:hypothetical protein